MYVYNTHYDLDAACTQIQEPNKRLSIWLTIVVFDASDTEVTHWQGILTS